MTQYRLEHSRSPEQRAAMERLVADGVCVFCPGNLDQEVVHRTGRWTVTPNKFPYDGTKYHLLLVPDPHVSDLLDLPGDVQAEFWTALGWVRDTYRLDYYSLGVRCGDCRYTGSTIEHVHAHVIVGDRDDPAVESIKVKLYQRPKA